MNLSQFDYVANKIEFEYADLEEAFPTVDPQHSPNGEFVIVQLRTPKQVTAGGIILTSESQQTEQDNTQVAKVVAVGPVAFRNRQTGEEWAGGAWYNPGDYVRCPKYGGDRWRIKATKVTKGRKVGNIEIPDKTEETEAIFALFMDKDIRLNVTGDPRRIKAFL